MSFYSRFTQLCEERGKAPSVAAREAGINGSGPSSWKRGMFPKRESVRKLAAYFNVSENYLLGREIGGVGQKGDGEDAMILSLDRSYFYDGMKLAGVEIGKSGKVRVSFEVHESGLSVGDAKDVLETVRRLCEDYGLSASVLMRLTEAAANVMAEKS